MGIFGKPRFGAPFEYNGQIAPQLGVDIDPMQLPVDGPTNVGKKRGLFGGLTGDQPFKINPRLAMLSQIFTSLGGGDQNPAFSIWAAQEQQRQRQEQDAAERQARLQDQITLYDYERNNPKPSTAQPYRWEDNAGNVWELQPDGNTKRIFTDQAQRTFLQDGQMVTVPNPYLQTAPIAPVGKLTPFDGGAPQAPRPFASPPVRLNHGAMTSGRRTVEGNRAVGGVPNSQHLSGRAADWTGPDLNALLAEVRGLPGNKRAFIHNGNHVHGEGGWDVPYFGKRGTIGQR